jgi:hypothetical protein
MWRVEKQWRSQKRHNNGGRFHKFDTTRQHPAFTKTKHPGNPRPTVLRSGDVHRAYRIDPRLQLLPPSSVFQR